MRVSSFDERLEQTFMSLNQKFSTLDQKFSTLDQKFATLDQKFATLDQKFSTLDQKVSSLVDVQKQQHYEHCQQLSCLQEELKQTMLGAHQKLQKDIFSMQKKQDMIFTKQDQIQSTLYGDMPPLQSNTSSVVALSPPFTSPTASNIGFRMTTHVEEPQQPQQNVVSDITSGLDDRDLESMLSYSYDWDQPTQQPPQAGCSYWADSAALLQEGTPQGGIFELPQQQQQGSTTMLPQQAGPPKQDSTAILPQQAQGVSGRPQQENTATFPQQGTLQYCIQGLSQQGRDTGSQHMLRDPADVVKQASLFGVKDAGKFARLLASQAFFGDDVLRVSTVRGDMKRGLRALDSSTMGALINCIHQHPSFVNLTKLEFDDIVKKSVVPSIGHLCKELRNKR